MKPEERAVQRTRETAEVSMIEETINGLLTGNAIEVGGVRVLLRGTGARAVGLELVVTFPAIEVVLAPDEHRFLRLEITRQRGHSAPVTRPASVTAATP